MPGFRVISNPEFLREGSAIADTLRPDRIVAGGAPDDRGIVEQLYGPILRQDFPPVGELRPLDQPRPLCWMDRRSSELAKYASNAFLATKLSFVNELANLAAVTRSDLRAVTAALAADPRIGPSFLRPGIGWGGSCFPKDTRALAAFSLEEGYDFTVLRAVIEQNNLNCRGFSG
jgi:UDPglucose 6-dehydrogenase